MSPRRAPGLASLSRTLNGRNGRIFFGGSLVAWTGLWAQRVSVGWLAWELAGSPLWLSVVVFADLFPSIVVAPLAGAVADRTDRVRLTMASQTVSALQAFILAALVVAQAVSLPLLIALEVVVGVANAFTQPARQTLIPAIVPREDLAGAVALNALVFNVARFAGPAIAGGLIVQAGVVPPILLGSGLTTRTLRWRRCGLRRGRLRRGGRIGLRYA